MMARHSSAFALPLLAVVACGGGGGSTDIESTITFADRTDQEIARLIAAAGGTEMFSAENVVNQFGDTFDADPACPTITIDGDTATVTGGCTTADGVTIDGSAVAINPFAWDQIEDFDYTSDSTYEMDALTITQGGFATTYDGFVTVQDSFATYDADVTMTQLGAAVRSDLHYHCSNPSSPSCSMSGSGLELIGVGGATVSGKVKSDSDAESQTADFTLKGTDTLTVHVNEQHCIAWQIDGTDRQQVCAPSS